MLILPFPSFTLSSSYSLRVEPPLVLESIDRFGFCRFPLSHPLVLVLSDIPTSTFFETSCLRGVQLFAKRSHARRVPLRVDVERREL